MSQAELAEALGVSRGAVNSWENDRTYPQSSIGALEEVLDVDLTSDAATRERVIPPDLQRKIDALPEWQAKWVVERLTRRRARAEDDTPEAREGPA